MDFDNLLEAELQAVGGQQQQAINPNDVIMIDDDQVVPNVEGENLMGFETGLLDLNDDCLINVMQRVTNPKDKYNLSHSTRGLVKFYTTPQIWQFHINLLVSINAPPPQRRHSERITLRFHETDHSAVTEFPIDKSIAVLNHYLNDLPTPRRLHKFDLGGNFKDVLDQQLVDKLFQHLDSAGLRAIHLHFRPDLTTIGHYASLFADRSFTGRMKSLVLELNGQVNERPIDAYFSLLRNALVKCRTVERIRVCTNPGINRSVLDALDRNEGAQLTAALKDNPKLSQLQCNMFQGVSEGDLTTILNTTILRTLEIRCNHTLNVLVAFREASVQARHRLTSLNLLVRPQFYPFFDSLISVLPNLENFGFSYHNTPPEPWMLMILVKRFFDIGQRQEFLLKTTLPWQPVFSYVADNPNELVASGENGDLVFRQNSEIADMVGQEIKNKVFRWVKPF